MPVRSPHLQRDKSCNISLILTSGRQSIGVIEFLLVLAALDARRTDQTRQCAGRVCSARKSANVYLIARFVVSNHKPIGILDDFCEPKANSSTEELCDKIAVRPYSVVIMEFCTVPFVARDFMKASASRLQNESAARWAAYLLERKVAQRESAYIGTK